MKFREIKCYKQKKNGELKLVKVIKRPIRGRQLIHNVSDACLPHDYTPEKSRKGTQLYPMDTIITSRLRTSQHPEGTLQWREVYHGYYWLKKRDVKKLGVIKAYQKQQLEYYNQSRRLHKDKYSSLSDAGIVLGDLVS